MKKKLFCILTMLCFCLLSAQAFAAADGGDVSGGLRLTTLPTEETTYTAGTGTITFTPAAGANNAKLTLNNVQISNSYGPTIDISLDSSVSADFDIEVIGTNNLEGFGAISNSNGALSIYSTGTKGIINAKLTGMNAVFHSKSSLSFDNITCDITNNYGSQSFYHDTTDGYVTIANCNFTLNASGSISPLMGVPHAIYLKGDTTFSTPEISHMSTDALYIYPDARLIVTTEALNTANINSYIPTFYNNGVLQFNNTASNPVNIINANLLGTGTVLIDTENYLNKTGSNTPLLAYFTNFTLESGDEATYTRDQYDTTGIYVTRDTSDNWEMHLKNVHIQDLRLPTNDCTIVIDGDCVINNISYTGDYGTNHWTIKGSSQNVKLYSNGIIDTNNGSLTIQNLKADLGFLSNTIGTRPIKFENSTLSFSGGIFYSDAFGSYPGDHGLTLTNTKLSVFNGDYYPYSISAEYYDRLVGEYLWAAIINLDTDSQIELSDMYISNYGNCPNGLNGLTYFLPQDYSIGHYTLDGSNAYTVFDEDGNRATNFTLHYNVELVPSSSSGSRNYTITATAGDGGSISPKGSMRVAKGATKTFTITADKGYAIEDVLVDDTSVGAVASYTFENVTSGHTISATFKSANVPSGLNGKDHTAYIKGYEDKTVRPNANITRAETATMIYRLLTEEKLAQIKTTKHNFSEIPTDAWYLEAVATLANGGYITGYDDGTFLGNQYITRAEFVTMLVRFIEPKDTDCDFADVSADHWAYKYIAAAAANGWVTGYEDGTFRPNNNITRAEAIAILNRVLARGINENSELGDFVTFSDNPTDGWYYYEVIEAANSHDYTGLRPNENWTKLN